MRQVNLSHEGGMMTALEIESFGLKIPESDVTILRRLAERVAEIADLPIQKETRKLWGCVNDLKQIRPVVLIRQSEVPWNEFDHIDELKLACENDFSHSIETNFRQVLYQWQHMRCDMVVDNIFESPLLVLDTGIGFQPVENTIPYEEGNTIESHHFQPQIKDEKDIEKIQIPQVTHHEQISHDFFELRKALFGDILNVRMHGCGYIYSAFWDDLVRWWGPQEALMDLVLRPDLVHMAMQRLLEAWQAKLDQYEERNLLSPTSGNEDIGSGGLGYTGDLPSKNFNPNHVKAGDLWGFNTAQIFTDVSPDMYEEFALRYEQPWLERFGLSYYGCCEKLHDKIHLLKKISNLRKISISPWAHVEKAAEQMDDQYVMSIKPNPAVLASDKWNPHAAREDLKRSLDQSRGCNVELIMKDISTVRGEPQRLKEWAAIAMEIVEDYY